jgi:hypothetical protein
LGEGRTAFAASGFERQMESAVFLSPELAPEAAILPQPFVSFKICKDRIVTRVALGVEKPSCRQEADQSDSGWPNIS